MKQIIIKNSNKSYFLFAITAIMMLLIGIAPSQIFALTPVGTVVGNQATATYNDTSGNQFTAQSNLFTVTVSQVAGLSLMPSSQSRAGAPANEVQFPHTVENPGNGTDTFNLTTATGGAVTLGAITIIQDDNGDGTANPGEPAITFVTLNMNQSQMIVVRATIPSSAANNASGTITLTATSTFNSTVTQSSVDTANVVTTAVISLAKAVSTLTANPGVTLDYTINYTNVGVASTAGIAVILNTVPETRHVVRDVIPANTTFTSFLGIPTPSFGQLVYHATGALEHTYVTAVPPSFDAVAYLFTTALTGGQSGLFSFRVTVNASAQVGTINNQTIMHFNNGAIATSQASNTTGTLVNLMPSVLIRDTDSPLDDIQVVSVGSAGSTISFVNAVQNTSNGADRYNITVANGNYPAGTTFSFFGADGITPLLDTNADGIPDTGAMNASTTLNVIMKATLPANASNTGAPFNATTTARSVANNTVSDIVINSLSMITGPGVDVTNTSAGAGTPGTGIGPEGSPVVTVFGNPGATVNVDMHIRNTGPNPDSFDVQFSNVGASFAAGVLPANISAILFFLGDGSGNPTGAPIMSTGQISAGGNKEIIARVTVSPAVAGATNINLFFRGISVASAAADIIMDRLTVNTVRAISLLQNQNGQTSSGSATTYSHVLKNMGNVIEPQINLTATNSQPGFLTTIYLDNNGDGLINGADAVATSTSALGAGSSTSLIIRVAAPSSAANGAVDSMTLTATPTGTVNTVGTSPAQSNSDQTTVVTGQIEMTLSALPAGSQPPGTTVTYTISYQNVGAASVSSLLVTDAIPVNTTFVIGSMRLNGTTILTDGADADIGTLMSGTKGSVQFNIGTVASGANGTVSFNVIID
ncbi:MAG: hypothetical protein AAB035_01470 [Nitrospirota bacterium]